MLELGILMILVDTSMWIDHFRNMKFRLRTLFLITTVVAIVVFTFTLGSAEGVFTLVFFASIFATPKKDRWITGLLVVLIWGGPGFYGWYFMHRELGRPSNDETACVDIFFTGCDTWEREIEIWQFLLDEMPSSCVYTNQSHVLPFFNPGYIKLSFDEKILPEIEAKVRRKIAEKFPDLSVSIEGYSTSDRR